MVNRNNLHADDEWVVQLGNDVLFLLDVLCLPQLNDLTFLEHLQCCGLTRGLSALHQMGRQYAKVDLAKSAGAYDLQDLIVCNGPSGRVVESMMNLMFLLLFLLHCLFFIIIF